MNSVNGPFQSAICIPPQTDYLPAPCTPPQTDSDSPSPLPGTVPHHFGCGFQYRSQARERSEDDGTPLVQLGRQHAMREPPSLGRRVRHRAAGNGSSTANVARRLFTDREMGTPQPPPSPSRPVSQNNQLMNQLFEAFRRWTLADPDTGTEDPNDYRVHHVRRSRVELGRGVVETNIEETDELELDPLIPPPPPQQAQRRLAPSLSSSTHVLTQQSQQQRDLSQQQARLPRYLPLIRGRNSTALTLNPAMQMQLEMELRSAPLGRTIASPEEIARRRLELATLARPWNLQPPQAAATAAAAAPAQSQRSFAAYSGATQPHMGWSGFSGTVPTSQEW